MMNFVQTIVRKQSAIMSTHRASRMLLNLRGHLNGNIVRRMTSTSGISPAAQAVLDTRKSVKVLDSHMSYLDTAAGDNVVLFLHGNPTAAFLWRNIIPHVSPIARCVAPDLIGMGHSGKPDIMYKYEEHYKYLSTWIEQMNFPQKLTIVCHDWGSGLGLHWCNMNRSRVQSIVHMESLVGVAPNWDAFPELAREIFQALRSDAGEDLVLKKNFFVERLLVGSIQRELSPAELAEYRAPYKDSEKSRLPTLTWPREIPIASDGPENVVKIANDYIHWLGSDANVPKLYIHAVPGFFSEGIKMAIADWPNQKIVEAQGLHFLQEDSPDTIGRAIKDFLSDLYRK